jgi:hypothetical protein
MRYPRQQVEEVGSADKMNGGIKHECQVISENASGQRMPGKTISVVL